MLLRFALCVSAAAMIVFGAHLVFAQTPPEGAAKPGATQTAPASPPPAPTTGGSPQSSDPFGEDITLTAKPIVYVKGTGNWDRAFETITKSLKTVKAYVDKEGLKIDGQPMTLFTSTDDAGFSFEAAIPIAEPPKNPPRGDMVVGTSPEGHALKFVHRGSYDALDNTYEAITNYLDERRLEAKDMFIEQYVTDPLSTGEDHLVVNIFVLVK